MTFRFCNAFLIRQDRKIPAVRHIRVTHTLQCSYSHDARSVSYCLARMQTVTRSSHRVNHVFSQLIGWNDDFTGRYRQVTEEASKKRQKMLQDHQEELAAHEKELEQTFRR